MPVWTPDGGISGLCSYKSPGVARRYRNGGVCNSFRTMLHGQVALPRRLQSLRATFSAVLAEPGAPLIGTLFDGSDTHELVRCMRNFLEFEVYGVRGITWLNAHWVTPHITFSLPLELATPA